MILFIIIMYIIFRIMNPFYWFYRPYRPYGYYRPFFGFYPLMFGRRWHHRPPMGAPGGFRHMGGPGGPYRW